MDEIPKYVINKNESEEAAQRLMDSQPEATKKHIENIKEKVDNDIINQIINMHPIELIHPHIEGWGTLKKAMKLYSLVVTHKAKITVEVGVFCAKSLIGFSYGHKEMGGQTYGIDPWKASESLSGSNDPRNDEWWQNLDYEKLYRDTMITLMAHELTAETNILRMTSKEASLLFKERQIDILHLDGNHSEESSVNDVEIWAPLIKSEGFLIFDDSCWPSTQPAQRLLLEYGFQEVERIEEGEGIEWTVYKKLSA